jgi:glutathione S-transferase
MNTLEQLAMFLPALWIFANYVSELWAAVLGVVWILGRAIYFASYVKDPKTRSLGFALTAVPMLAMLLGILIWGVNAAIKLAAV